MHQAGLIKLLSNTGLRQRWRVGGLVGQPELTNLIEGSLKRRSLHISKVTADPFTGRVLILFDEACGEEEVSSWIESTLCEIQSMSSAERLSASSRSNARSVGVFTLIKAIPALKVLLVFKAVVYSVVFNFLNILPPLIFAAIAYLGMNGGFPFLNSLGVNSVTFQFILISVGGLFLYALRTYFSFSTRDAWRELGQTVQYSLRAKVFEKIQYLPLTYVAGRTDSVIRDVVVDDTAAVQEFYEKGLEDFIRKVVTLVFVQLVYMFLSPLVAIIIFFIVFGFWVSWTVFHRNAVLPFKSAVHAAADLNDHVYKNISGTETVRSYVAEKMEIQRMGEASLDAQEASKRATLMTWFYSHFVEFSLFVCFLMILTISGIMLAHGLIDIGAFIILVFLIPRVGVIFDGVEDTLEIYQRANAASQRILDLMAVKTCHEEDKLVLEPSEIQGEVEYRNITFAYPERSPVILDTSLRLPAGSSCAFVGSTGSGKSTLAKLLLRFYDLDAGEICLDGTNIADLNVQMLRSNIGYVSQDTYLFDGTLIDNIRFGRPDASLEEVVEVTKMVGVYDFISSLENGLDTLVGERGQFLSGGQRQLISIARAVIKNPKIFIFDEATSSLDNETEAMIHHAITNVMRERTTIIIAHRLSTITNVDQIHLLSDGAVRESGTHEEMLKSDGLYAALWRFQSCGLG